MASKMRVHQLLIDEQDKDLAKWKWRLDFTGYVIRGPMGKPGSKYTIRLHRVVLERMLGRPLQPTEHVDHINRNRLDNRRCNLRLATTTQNSRNLTPRGGCTSQYIGVSWSPSKHCWVAYINVERQRLFVGRFHDEHEAAWRRDQWALALHGRFASLNFDYVPAQEETA